MPMARAEYTTNDFDVSHLHICRMSRDRYIFFIVTDGVQKCQKRSIKLKTEAAKRKRRHNGPNMKWHFARLTSRGPCARDAADAFALSRCIIALMG
ncbi:hypothetical protein EVAR_57407_1 [Eumeta japonica]|uniref:Uncharacterized protein n=1 Tax=Eumeta variegata TaxID=151549 RepID=A0A4C1YFD0_EUMVA|nr:hypothetical protein EVAR_57407_1 [Eumeta japonica]